MSLPFGPRDFVEGICDPLDWTEVEEKCKRKWDTRGKVLVLYSLPNGYMLEPSATELFSKRDFTVFEYVYKHLGLSLQGIHTGSCSDEMEDLAWPVDDVIDGDKEPLQFAFYYAANHLEEELLGNITGEKHDNEPTLTFPADDDSDEDDSIRVDIQFGKKLNVKEKNKYFEGCEEIQNDRSELDKLLQGKKKKELADLCKQPWSGLWWARSETSVYVYCWYRSTTFDDDEQEAKRAKISSE